MGALNRFWLAVLVVAAAGVAALLVLGRTTSPPGGTATAPLVVRARFVPASVSFGDRVDARVVVVVDRAAVRPSTLKIVAGVAPLTQLATPRTTRTTRGDIATITYAVPATCVTDRCVSAGGGVALRLPRATVTVETRSGSGVKAEAVWPTLHVRGRVRAADIAGRPRFLGDASPTAPTYRVTPSSLATLLDVLAVLLALGGIALAAFEARRLARRRRARPLDGGELARALRLARAAESRTPPDRRRALGLLARVLDRRDAHLADEASRLAWARPQPEPESISGLVAEVEHEVPT
jgi:hypothetical protein